MIFLILIGPPGSGKGTQALRLCERYALKHLSTGDLFREEMRRATTLGEEIRQIVDSGQLVPDKIVHKAVVTTLSRLQGKVGVLLDGYPRTLQQAKALDVYLSTRPEAEQDKLLVLRLDVSEDELKERICLRGQSSGRADDQDSSKISRRFEIYMSQTEPVLEYYRQQGKLQTQDALGEVSAIFSALCGKIEAQLRLIA